MAGTTPIYGFPYPESSDLVADYPALGQDLAEDVETVIAAIPPGGLAHIATESFTAVSSVSLNGVFTSAYENYLAQMTITGSSVDGAISQLRLRVSGSDAATNYKHSTSRTYWSGSLGFYTAGNPSTIYYINENTSSAVNSASIQFFTPNLVTKTTMTHTAVRAGLAMEFGGCSHDTAAAYDGFSILANTGNITGTIRVYGYANS